MSRLPPHPHERIDRTRELAFTFEGRRVSAFPGDTFGSALYAAGQRVFSRSFKYHRPRGLQCCSGHCANCQMTVDGVPNVRVCVEPVREGAVVQGQNYLGSLERDLLQVTDKLGGPFTPPGFYYKTFIRPRRLWPLYEKLLRHAAGLGRLDEHGARGERVEVEHRHVDTIVIGGGEAGLEAAAEAAQRGESVLLVDEGPEVGGSLLSRRGGAATARELAAQAAAAGVELLAPATAIGIFEYNLVPVATANLLLKVRARRVVVASGVTEQPLVFPGNDLVGVMLPEGVRRLVNYWSLKPGERAVVLTADERGLDAAAELEAAGVELAHVVDLRTQQPPNIEAAGRRGRVQQVGINGRWIACDLVVMSGSPQPSYKLLAQAGARVAYDAGRGVFVPRDLPPRVEAVGACAGDVGEPAVPAPQLGYRGDKCFVCFCEDQTTKDLKHAIAEGFDSIELSKRYTTVTMGPCQGRLCQLGSIRVYAKANGVDEATIGTTTARPPYAPVPLGVLAGRPQEPVKRTSLHHRHEDLGGKMMWTGAWKRPHSYSDDPGEEAQHVHRALGLIDVSTLGKLLVEGPDAGAFLDRLYPNRFSDLKPGRIRYGVLTTDAGRIMDDGTVARLDEQTYYVTTTSTGADGVYQWFTWWNAVWRLDVEVANVTGALAAVNVAGPNAREAMQRVSPDDYANDAFAYLDAKHVRVAGVPTLALRIGFVGELGYELHFPSAYGEHVWDALLERAADLGARPFGLEPQRILRLEKGHVIVSQDTDSESNLLEAAMPWIFKQEKEDFVGKWGTQQVAERGLRWLLVGFESPTGVMPLEGGQVVVDGRSAGRVTSVRRSAELGKVIGLAVVPHELAVDGGRFDVRVDGRLVPMTVHLGPFFDPEGARLKA
ncbi:MAG TPA: 2Fe-2S iron-sulfur cluster-binding protein [Gaiellaceae bacterium]|nr:2Fe-2S iron-sulfur cluster-binding protein [Gaiellaceae bacterium]